MSVIDYVVKIGGSVLYSISKTKEVLDKFEKSEENTVFYVGSGYIGEEVKKIVNSEEMNIEFTKQNGFMITSSIHKINALILNSLNKNFSLCFDKEECIWMVQNKYKPILDSEGFSNVLKNAESLQTDYQSALLCNYFDVKKLVIVTDVNGVFLSDPKKNRKAQRLKNITTKQLRNLGKSNVDLSAIEVIEESNIECIVVGCDEIISMKKCNYENIKSIGTVVEVKND